MFNSMLKDIFNKEVKEVFDKVEKSGKSMEYWVRATYEIEQEVVKQGGNYQSTLIFSDGPEQYWQVRYWSVAKSWYIHPLPLLPWSDSEPCLTKQLATIHLLTSGYVFDQAIPQSNNAKQGALFLFAVWLPENYQGREYTFLSTFIIENFIKKYGGVSENASPVSYLQYSEAEQGDPSFNVIEAHAEDGTQLANIAWMPGDEHLKNQGYLQLV